MIQTESEIDNANFIEKDKCYLVYDDFGDFRGVVLTADVEEVVRCKDCIHNHEHETPFGSKFHICNINNLAFTQYADFYCAYGERREDGKIH